MRYLNLENIKIKLYNLDAFKVFIISLFICVIFYFFEGLIGIDRFYHPDSTHYLTKYYDFKFNDYFKQPLKIFDNTYYHITNLFYDNYYFLILLNFILYSLTNVFIFNKIFKKYFYKLNNIKLFFLSYLLFLDPYRLHLASHILKETFLIFFIILIIISNFKIIKISSIIILEGFRPNSWIYLLIFLTYSNIKKLIIPKIVYIFFAILILIPIAFFLIDLNLYSLIQINYEKFINFLEKYYNKTMPVRLYDHVPQFRDYGFPVGFILKNVIWPFMMVSGFFIFFVSSILLKFLGIIIIFNNLLIYVITKNTFISLGLVVILLMISVYTSSYTAMFRYSYVAIYSSIVYFFLSFDLKKI